MGDDWQIRYESLIDQQIRAAEARGEFDDLPGAGKPLTGLDKPYSEDWWLKQLAERENIGRHALPRRSRCARRRRTCAPGSFLAAASARCATPWPTTTSVSPKRVANP